METAMKALVLPSAGKFVIADMPLPPKPGPHEVICMIMAVAICGTDPHIIRGEHAGKWPQEYPFIPGHEWAGIVHEVGEGVHNFAVGDRVAGEAHKGCGFCKNCLAGSYNNCLNYGVRDSGHEHYGFHTFGAYAQYGKFSVKSIKRLPANVSFVEGAMADTAGVSMHGINRIGVTPGGSIAVIGPGPIGLMAAKIGRACGAAKVIMVGRGERLKASARHGCDELVDFTSADPVGEVRKMTNGLGADEVFECSGAPGTLAQAIRMAKRGGKVCLLGMAADSVIEEVPFKHIQIEEISVVGSRANPNVTDSVLNLIASGNIKVKDLVSHTFPLVEFEQAYKTYTQRLDGAMKVVILPNPEE